ncbi:MAG TPA: FG-GAP repeat protein [Solirubrobacteraceae bacterium]|nr:FG-GAP repeat protein [Solirubrobacteraceae bacterium]
MHAVSLVVLVVVAIAAPSAAAATKPYDFDGDGRQELVAGLPDMAVGLPGAVLVVDGTKRTIITESSAGLPGGSELFDQFGSSIASGDFNGDGFADLAVGSDEWEQARGVILGGVTVLYGSATGLKTTDAQQFLGTVQTLVEGGESFDVGSEFGGTLAAGDLNRDGADDLVVGATYEKPNPESENGSGAIHLLFGGAKGLTRTGERLLARPHGDDNVFGLVLALGDVDRDGDLDIVEGANGRAYSVDARDFAGRLSYCAGAAGGPTSCRTVSPRQSNYTGDPGRKREAPASLAVGDVTGDGFPDIVEGVPEDRVYESRPPAGAILIRRGTSHGPSKRVLRITQATRGVPGRPGPGDAFGETVAVGRIDSDRFADIVVGATGEDRLHGRVTVLRGGPKGVRTSGAREYGRETRGMPRTGLEFGAALTLLDHNADRRLDLTVGSRGLDRNGGLAKGTLVTLFGRRRAPSTTHAIGIDWTDVGVGPRDATGLGSVLGR